MRHEEHDQQVRFFQMMKMLEDLDESFLTFYPPNGARFINRIHAKRVSEEGMKKGVPDIMCCVPRAPFVGLAIEMKTPANKNGSTVDQKRWQMMLRKVGWHVLVCTSAEEAFNQWALYNSLDDEHYSLIARNFMFSQYVESIA